MSQAKTVLQGFIAVASIISLFVSAIWLLNAYLNPWIGVPIFLFLAFPFAINCIILFMGVNEKKPAQAQVIRAKKVLMAPPGVGIACWFFDVLSTILVINLAQSGDELNPLGWPYSAPAALDYYVPIAFVTYYLLFKIKKPASFWVAVAVSVATLIMSARNFLASLNNFGPGIFTQDSFNPSVTNLEILFVWSAVVTILAVLNFASMKAIRKIEL